MPPYQWPTTGPKTEPQLLIHIVTNGKTLCGTPSYMLKKNERWVEPRAWDVDAANCDECKARRKP